MAVTETVKIVFEVDDKALVSTVSQLQAVGKVSQEDAAKFNALNQASKAAGASLDGASKGAKQFADATKEVAKSAEQIKTVGTSLNTAGQSAKTASDGFVSLRTRLKEATLELQRLEDEFGPFSQEAVNARNKAGELADQFEDLQRQIRLTNPEGKVQAFQKLGQGIVGAFSVATGALQAFGAENEQVQQIASKLQGALNIAQGIQSIVGLKEAYEDVKVVLGFTTVAQETLTTATTAGKVATDGAALSTKGFAAALTSTGIGAIVVALGALVGAYLLYSNSTEEAKADEEALKAAQDASKESTDRLKEATDKLAVARGQKTQEQVDKENALAESLKRQEELNKKLGDAISEQLNAQAELNKLSGGAAPSIREERQARLDAAKAAVAQAAAAIQAEKDALSATNAYIDLNKQQKDGADAVAKAEREISDAINRRLGILSEEQKQRQFSIELNKLYGASEEDILRQKLFNNEADQEALNAILLKAKGTEQYEQIQSQLNDSVREEIVLRKQLENELEIQKVTLKGIGTQQEKNNQTTKEAVPIAQEGTKSTAELNEAMFAKTDRQKEWGKETVKIAKEVNDFILDINQRRLENEQNELEKQRDQGLITEEQYQEKVLQLRRKQAQADKNAAIFNATLGLAEAIIKALNAPPPVSFASVALASALATVNLAKIIATPLPKFKKGTLAVPGTDTGDDSVMAMLRPGEAVIPTEINKEYASAIKAIYTRKVSSKDLNDFVNSRMSVVRDEPVFNFNPVTLDALYKRDLRISQMSGAVSRASGGSTSINIKANVDTHALGKAMSKNKSMEVTNVESIGEAVAEAINRRTNRRQQI